MKKSDGCEKYKDIDKQVKVWVQGKHGKIGIIVPDNEPTEEEWIKFNQDITEIVFNYHLQKGKSKTTPNQ